MARRGQLACMAPFGRGAGVQDRDGAANQVAWLASTAPARMASYGLRRKGQTCGPQSRRGESRRSRLTPGLSSCHIRRARRHWARELTGRDCEDCDCFASSPGPLLT